MRDTGLVLYGSYAGLLGCSTPERSLRSSSTATYEPLGLMPPNQVKDERLITTASRCK